MTNPYPSLAQIRDTAARLQGKVLHTPVWRWQTGVIEEQFPSTEVWLKLELFQKTGTFKLRAAASSASMQLSAPRSLKVPVF